MLLLIVTIAGLRSYQTQRTPSSLCQRCKLWWRMAPTIRNVSRSYDDGTVQERFTLSSAAALRGPTTPGRPTSTYDNRLPSSPVLTQS